MPHQGFGSFTPFDTYNGQFEARLASWTTPSLAVNLKGTWLADLIDKMTPTDDGPNFIPPGVDPEKAKAEIARLKAKGPPKYADQVDAYLYLGRRDQLLKEPAPAEVTLDQAYMAEMKRRAALMAIGPADEFDPEVIFKAEAKSIFLRLGVT